MTEVSGAGCSVNIVPNEKKTMEAENRPKGDRMLKPDPLDKVEIAKMKAHQPPNTLQ